MEPNIANLIHLPTPAIELENTSSKMSLGQVFADRSGYINELNLFIAHFNYIPNLISEANINCKKANKWFNEN